MGCDIQFISSPNLVPEAAGRIKMAESDPTTMAEIRSAINSIAATLREEVRIKHKPVAGGLKS